jgi:hypothetical protein
MVLVRTRLQMNSSFKDVFQNMIDKLSRTAPDYNEIYKRYHPPNNKPSPMFASPTVFKEQAAPVDATILRVALADPEVADPELREDVPEAGEAEEADDAIKTESAGI